MSVQEQQLVVIPWSACPLATDIKRRNRIGPSDKLMS